MNYKDPNFNVIISSPGRTGSLLIASMFVFISKITPKIRYQHDNKNNMNAKECLHSHNPNDVYLMNDSTMFIVSKRNLIDSTFSQLIGNVTNQWRYYDRNYNIELKPFEISKTDFLCVYDTKKTFYEDLKLVLPKKYTVLDYKDFNTDINKLINLLELPPIYLKFASKQYIPKKTPGTYKDWIINYDEIYEFAQTLDPSPCI
jgi:hypothetical protein